MYDNVKQNQTFHYTRCIATRCIAPKLVASLRSPSPRRNGKTTQIIM